MDLRVIVSSLLRFVVAGFYVVLAGLFVLFALPLASPLLLAFTLGAFSPFLLPFLDHLGRVAPGSDLLFVYMALPLMVIFYVSIAYGLFKKSKIALVTAIVSSTLTIVANISNIFWRHVTHLEEQLFLTEAGLVFNIILPVLLLLSFRNLFIRR